MSTTILLPVQATPHESFLESIEDFFKGIFSEADHLYNKLTATEKAAAVWGSGVISAINHDLDAAPADVVSLIEKAFPGLSLDNVHGFLDELLNAVNNIQGEVPLTLEEAITAVQKYLKQYDGALWGVISGTAATILSVLISPETPIEKFINIATTVYQAIVRPHVIATAASLAPKAKLESFSPPADLLDENKSDNIPPADENQSENTYPNSEAGAQQNNEQAPEQEKQPADDPDMQISNDAKEELAAGSEEPFKGNTPSFDEIAAKEAGGATNNEQ